MSSRWLIVSHFNYLVLIKSGNLFKMTYGLCGAYNCSEWMVCSAGDISNLLRCTFCMISFCIAFPIIKHSNAIYNTAVHILFIRNSQKL